MFRLFLMLCLLSCVGCATTADVIQSFKMGYNSGIETSEKNYQRQVVKVWNKGYDEGFDKGFMAYKSFVNISEITCDLKIIDNFTACWNVHKITPLGSFYGDMLECLVPKRP